jgi:hypothetical protein
MADRQLLISFQELPVIEITCLCGTSLAIPVLSSAPKLKTECPGCGRSLHPAAEAVLGFREFFSKAMEFISLPRDDSNPVEKLADRSIRLRKDD